MFQKDQLSIWNWLGFTVVMIIPIVNLVFLIMLLVSPNTNKTLKNYLIAQIICLVITVLVMVLFMAQLVTYFEGFLP